MASEVMDFEVFLIETYAKRRLNGDAVKSYSLLNNSGVLEYYRKTYDVSHTLGSDYLMDEIDELISNQKAKVQNG